MGWASDVAEFNKAFGAEMRSTPGWPADEVLDLRRKLIIEEYGELTDAWMMRELPETVDAIIDLCYVLIGALGALGVEPEEVWAAVHEANMAKLGGGRRDDGKILKPKGWNPPDIQGILEKQGEHNG